MKKLWIGIATMALVMGIGTAGVYAATVENGTEDSGIVNNQDTYEQMLPYAKQMHPDLSEDQIRGMYNSCHGGNGSGVKGMMNNIKMGSNLMNF
ncbi:FAD/FMN-containing dehydrogenase [Paenibacillus vini]|uniref:FAD/FMN-containing dehydrogenase n=1 Tax=Paenibacillus vini TaxID=1476024 RepID=UPI0025B6B100|nr:FAD/FMN-containing dehydrogenase [Paenibacillus vini]MDN4067596.1 FAD/FMN-containing dehydrogenase [Paenibacillus vini]